MAARFFEKLLTFLFDVVAINVAFVTAFWLRYKSNFFPEAFNPDIDISSYFVPALILTVAWIVLFFITGLYRDWNKESRLDEFMVVSRTVVIGIFLLFLITGAPQIIDFAKTGDVKTFFTRTKLATLFTYGICMLFFSNVNRFTVHTVLTWLFVKGIGVSRVLIIGAHKSGEQLLDDLKRYPSLGYEVKGSLMTMEGRKARFAAVFGSWEPIPIFLK